MTNEDISLATQRLSTGYRINQASDDSSGLQISERLTSQIIGTQTSSNNIEQGISMINTIDSGLQTIQEVLVRTRELLIQANNGTNSEVDVLAIKQEITQNLNTIDQLVNSTFFNGMQVLNSSSLTSGGAIISNTFESTDTSVANVDQLFSNTNWQKTLTVDQLASTMEISSSSVTDINSSLGLNGQFEINNTVINIDSLMTLSDIKDTINSKNVGVIASIDSNKLVLAASNTGISNNFTLEDITRDNNTVTSTNSAVADITNTLESEQEWSHMVEVQQLSQKMEISSKSYTDTTSALGIQGKFSINGKIVSVLSGHSLSDIKDMINSMNAGVTASIDTTKKLHIVSNTEGEAGNFTFDDLTFRDDFSDPATLAENWTNPTGTGNWTVNSDQLLELSSGDWSSRKFLVANGTETYTGARIASAEFKMTSAGSFQHTGISLNYIDPNNRAYAYVREGTKELVLGKVVNGAAVSQTINLSNTFTANTTYKISIETDGIGTYTAKVYDSNGNLLGTNTKSGWNDIASKQGSSGFVTIGGSAAFGDFVAAPTTAEPDSILQSLGVSTSLGKPANLITEGQDAIYTIDGVSYTTSTNQIELKDEFDNLEATVNLNAAGTTTISNTKTDAILENLGVISNTGAIINVIQEGKNAVYSIDGTSFQSGKNDNINIGVGTVDLASTGTTTIQNSVVMDPSITTEEPSKINIHNDWKSDNATQLTLAQISVEGLNLNSLYNSLSGGISLVDEALNNILGERARFGAEKNRLNFNLQNLKINNINLQEARKRIEESDFSTEVSNLLKGEVKQNVLRQMYKISYQQQKDMLNLLNG